jgi:hypothetical protein
MSIGNGYKSERNYISSGNLQINGGSINAKTVPENTRNIYKEKLKKFKLIISEEIGEIRNVYVKINNKWKNWNIFSRDPIDYNKLYLWLPKYYINYVIVQGNFNKLLFKF